MSGMLIGRKLQAVFALMNFLTDDASRTSASTTTKEVNAETLNEPVSDPLQPVEPDKQNVVKI